MGGAVGVGRDPFREAVRTESEDGGRGRGDVDGVAGGLAGGSVGPKFPNTWDREGLALILD